MITGAHLLVKTLKSLGEHRIFGMCGDHVNALFEACADEEVGIVDVRHESAATHMADAWTRVTGGVGVSVVQGGPGHTNAITGLATAWASGSPIVAISGMHRWNLKEKGCIQEIDQLEQVRGITKWSRIITEPERLGEYLALAFREATRGRPGPVHLTIPVNVLEASIDGSKIKIPIPTEYEKAGVKDTLLESTLELLQRSERPVVIAGSGVWWGKGCESLQKLIEMTEIPCFTTGMARGAVSDEADCGFGYADPLVNPVANEIRESDAILLVGTRMDYRLRFGNLFSEKAHLIHVDIEASELGKNRPAEISIQADAGVFLSQLSEAAGKRKGWKSKPWLERLRRGKQSSLEARQKLENSRESPLHPLTVIKEVRETIGPEAIWVVDIGDFSQWSRVSLPALKPGRWLRPGPFGTLGATIPFGIAAKIAKPDLPVVIITGDGAVGFHGWELHTALRHKAPVIVIVGNDSGWGMERSLQQASYKRTVGVDLGLVRYDKFIENLGGHGEHVEKSEELKPALQRALQSNKASCVNVMIQGLPSPLTQAIATQAKGSSEEKK
jgi:acetolactate synthase-1/2/3 large subunit